MKKKTNDETKYWQKYSAIYDFTRKGDIKSYEKMYSLIKSRINNSMTILELATGTGLIALCIAENAKNIDATDFSAAMIEKAREKATPANVNFAVQDACNLPYADNSYDIVIISNALHIMPSPEKAMSEIKRVLKNDGILIAPTFTPSSSFKEKFIMKFMTNFTGFPAYAKWTSDEYIAFINQNGFAVKNKVLLKGALTMTYAECEKV